MRSQHQRTNLGSILERDWVTTNGLNVLRFGSGRKIWYNSGNFVFTTGNTPNFNKKHKLNTETKTWNWGDCESADGTVNSITPSYNTTDLRDYAYYGSCVELVRATIEEIISDFPGRLVRSNEILVANGEYVKDSSGNYMYEISNPFQIDLHHDVLSIDKYDNELRYMAYSYEKYCYSTNNGLSFTNITSYSIDKKTPSKCASDDEGKVMVTISINGNKIIYGYYIGGSIVYACKDNLIIQPQQEYIDEYFNGLSGFKKQLLRQDTKPLYLNDFITPTEKDFFWSYPIKQYAWPSTDYCIDIDTRAFESFVSDIYDIAQNFDNMWSDNIYRSMTHESIKNFDWSYRRQYTEGDEQDNVDGGERMQKILRVMGRVFDDVKIYMDALKLTQNVTYDKYKNGPEALLSESNSLHGIDVRSTIGKNYDLDTNISEGFNTYWYPTRKSTDVYPDVCDNEFMRRMLLSSKRIMQSKGTQEAIEMVFALFGFGKDEDYTITEEAYVTTPLDATKCVKDITTDGLTPSEVESTTVGDLAVEINSNKDLDLLYYSDTLSGVPMREVYLGKNNNSYLVPYYDSTQLYDGDLVFQCKGGWGKMSDSKLSYQETLSYLHVVSTISDLLSLNVNILEENEIYYVTNLDDYTSYDANPPIKEGSVTMSHYFYLVDKNNPEELSSWRNIVVQPTLDDDGNMQKIGSGDFIDIFGDEEDYAEWTYGDGAEEEGTYSHAFAKMQYLDNIVSMNTGNNPHVGYGNYDDGETYLEYMKKPFKYSIDHSLIQNFSLSQLADKFEFNVQSNGSDKIAINNSVESKWYINSKIVTIKNLRSGKLYNDYFKSIIMPYIMQVIPSTTILKLKGFS